MHPIELTHSKIMLTSQQIDECHIKNLPERIAHFVSKRKHSRAWKHFPGSVMFHRKHVRTSKRQTHLSRIGCVALGLNGTRDEDRGPRVQAVVKQLAQGIGGARPSSLKYIVET